MFKAILLFIKTHALATALTTTVVVGTAVVTPIAINNYNLDKTVKENLGMLVSSNFKVDDSSNIIENVSEQIDTNEPLTFRIEKIYTETEGGNIVKDMQGNDAYEMTSNGVEYKIIPSYDKDYSEWTNEEKKAYQKTLNEIDKMGEEDYQNAIENERKNLQQALLEAEKFSAIASKEYMFDTGHTINGGMESTSECWFYDPYTNTYSRFFVIV